MAWVYSKDSDRDMCGRGRVRVQLWRHDSVLEASSSATEILSLRACRKLMAHWADRRERYHYWRISAFYHHIMTASGFIMRRLQISQAANYRQRPEGLSR